MRLPTALSSIRKPRATGKTAIVMFDTRKPEIGADNFWSLAAQLNTLYAEKFGYDFLYYLDDYAEQAQAAAGLGKDGLNAEIKSAPTCYLNGTVARSAPWGKLPALADALSRGYERVVYVDSDAFFRTDDAGISIEDLLKRYARSNADEEVLLWMASNTPWFAQDPNAGLQIWLNRPRSMSLLRRWWRFDVSAQRHPYEQLAVTKLFKRKRWPIAVMEELQWMEPEQWQNMPAIHICSAFKEHRMTQMRHHLGEQSVAELTIRKIDTTKVAQSLLE